jgi:hypothetical protein
VLIGLQLNFANIIALPLILGVGVAFEIYYIIAWHDGHCLREPLALSSPGYLEHGQADGPVAPGDRCHLPAGSHGDPAADAPDSIKGHHRCKTISSQKWGVRQKGNSHCEAQLLA